MDENKLKFALPLAITYFMGKVEGKTRMQKVTCLIQLQAFEKEEELFKFELYHHGPFSSELSMTLDELVSSGLLNIQVRANPHGGYLYTYSITPIGKEYLRDLLSNGVVAKDLQDKITNISDELKDLPLQVLINLTYREFGATPRRKVL